jgi:hypothetical protein
MEESEIAAAIRKRIQVPGWTTTRAILGDPAGSLPEDEHNQVAEVMRKMAAEGEVRLWRVTIQSQSSKLTAAARPDMELDTELSQREAWATAEEIKD